MAFQDRGTRELNGVSRGWRLYEVAFVDRHG
jgi:hypothetical protein